MSKFAANEGIAYIDAGLRGFGIIQPSRYMVAEMIEARTLCEILPDLPCPAIPLSIVYPQRSHISLRHPRLHRLDQRDLPSASRPARLSAAFGLAPGKAQSISSFSVADERPATGKQPVRSFR